MNPLQILIIATSHAVISSTGEPTGLWIEELTTPYYAFTDAGVEVTIASIDGGAVPIDPRSQKPIGENAASVDRFLQDKSAAMAIENTPAVE
ncbi:MAG: hypothetical protein QNJ34_06075 [Xenococcaceae cyanobacterium MO_188.B29]|nr:hypothetical protein [Xenococcaceae cyanobacterium MO_188.B29]